MKEDIFYVAILAAILFFIILYFVIRKAVFDAITKADDYIQERDNMKKRQIIRDMFKDKGKIK